MSKKLLLFTYNLSILIESQITMSPPSQRKSAKNKVGSKKWFGKNSPTYAAVSSNSSNDSSASAAGTTSESENEQENATQGSQSTIQLRLPILSPIPEPVQLAIRRQSAQFKRQKNIAIQNEAELKLFELVEMGDVSGIRGLLIKDDGNLNENIEINKSSLSGYTILHMAIQRDDEDLVRFLLSLKDIDIQDTLFHAIKQQNIVLIKMILHCEAEARPRRRSSLRTQSSTEAAVNRTLTKKDLQEAIQRCTQKKNEMEASEFDLDITPVMLAAHMGSYPLIKFFHDHGDFLPDLKDVHPPQCQCRICSPLGSVRLALKHLHYFEAVSNSSYMIYFARHSKVYDPILIAFELVQAMKKYKKVEHEISAAYDVIIEELNEFARDLLGLCRTSDEVQLLVGQNAGYAKKAQTVKLARLYLAIEEKQKGFVTHPHAQMVLYKQWAGNFWTEWEGLNIFYKLCLVVFRFLLWPIVSFWLLFTTPHYNSSSLGFSPPISRFFTSLLSYICFLVLLLLEVVLDFDANDTSVPRKRIQWLIVLFVIGHIISIIKISQFMRSQYFGLAWTWYDIATQAIFVVVFVFSVIAYWNADPLNMIIRNENGARKVWGTYEPLLIAEGFFAFATILSFGKILRLFQLSSHLGPVQIALGYMMKKVWTAIILIGLAILSFASSLCSLYKAYDSWVSKDESKSIQAKHFTTFTASFETLYWALFGMAPWDASKIVEINSTSGGGQHKSQHHFLTQFVGTSIFALFHIVATLILLNTVIAVMLGAGTVVFDDVDVEYKFARSQVWLFCEYDTKVPSPLNIFEPIRYLVISLLRKCGKCKKSNQEADKDIAANATLSKPYINLIKTLILRYFHDKAEASLQDQATSDQVTSLRETVADIKDKFRALSNNLTPLHKTRTNLNDSSESKARKLIGRVSDLSNTVGKMKPQTKKGGNPNSSSGLTKPSSKSSTMLFKPSSKTKSSNISIA